MLENPIHYLGDCHILMVNKLRANVKPLNAKNNNIKPSQPSSNMVSTSNKLREDEQDRNEHELPAVRGILPAPGSIQQEI
jgi:hypothetical protein